MCAKRFCKVSGVAQAREWGKKLTRMESRGAGDMENAWHRLETRYGIPWQTFWSLRYRPPSDVMHGIRERLRQAYEAECARQSRLLKHEAEITKALHPHAPDVAAAEALVSEMGEG